MWRTYGAPELPLTHRAVILPRFFLDCQASACWLDLTGWCVCVRTSEEKSDSGLFLSFCVWQYMRPRSWLTLHLIADRPAALFSCSVHRGQCDSSASSPGSWYGEVEGQRGLGTGSDAMLSLHFCCTPGTSSKLGRVSYERRLQLLVLLFLLGLRVFFWTSCGILF